MTKRKTISILNLVSFILMIGVNALAMIGLFGSSTQEISNGTPSLLMPMGFTFSIVWSVIYLLFGIYIVYQLINDNPINKEIGFYVFLTCFFNIMWILTYHLRLFLLSVIMIIMLFVDLFIIVRLTEKSNLLIKTTFGVYYGWITVATVVAIMSYASMLNPLLFNSVTMRVTSALCVLLLMMLAYLRRNDYAYVITITIAIAGILIKHIVDFNAVYPEMIYASVLAIIVVLSITLSNIINKNTRNLNNITGGKTYENL